MDFTAEYGLKTSQVASWIWKRRGVLNRIESILTLKRLFKHQNRIEEFEIFKYLNHETKLNHKKIPFALSYLFPGIAS